MILFPNKCFRILMIFLMVGALFACSDENSVVNTGTDTITSFEDSSSNEDSTSLMDTSSLEDTTSIEDSSLTDVSQSVPDVPEDVGQDTGEPDTTEPPVEDTIYAGWIGGACETDAVCDYDDSLCLTEVDTDLPGGMCSQDCDLYCPDQGEAITTFCVDGTYLGLFDSGGYCAMRCDYAVSASGCRPGYVCESLPRYNDPSTVIATCVPGTETEPPDNPPIGITNCQQELTNRGVGFTVGVNNMDSPAGHPNIICDVQDPVMIEPTIHGVTYRYASVNGAANSIYTSCQLALAIEETSLWLAEQNVTDVIHLGVYNCRLISGVSPPTLSEHGLANAIDIAGFRNADGSIYTVIDDWELNTSFPVTVPGSFLKWFVETVFENWIYNIILTPDYNAAHHDHFHCDLTPGAHFLQ